MLNIRTYAALSLSALLGALGLAPAAYAQAKCEDYGKLALQQQKDNEALKCGLTGPEWSGDLKAHIAWCGGVGPEQWRQALQTRAQKLSACKAGK